MPSSCASPNVRPSTRSRSRATNRSRPMHCSKGLGKQGLKEGEIFKQATLERVDLELERQYVAQGRYGASIDSKVEDLPRNRVAIHIEIKEGKTSTIGHINVVGNTAFDETTLLDQFELKYPSWLSFIKNDDKYSKEKLSGSLEKLESYYKDRGYVQFNVDSTQVSITPGQAPGLHHGQRDGRRRVQSGRGQPRRRTARRIARCIEVVAARCARTDLFGGAGHGKRRAPDAGARKFRLHVCNGIRRSGGARQRYGRRALHGRGRQTFVCPAHRICRQYGDAG